MHTRDDSNVPCVRQRRRSKVQARRERPNRLVLVRRQWSVVGGMPVPVGTRSQHYALYMQDSGQGTRLQFGEFELYYAAPSPPPKQAAAVAAASAAAAARHRLPVPRQPRQRARRATPSTGATRLITMATTARRAGKQCGGAYAFTAQSAPGTWLASIRAACTPPLAPPPSPGLPPAAPPPPAAPLLPRSEFYFRVFGGNCHANTGAAPYCVCSENYDQNCGSRCYGDPITCLQPPDWRRLLHLYGARRQATHCRGVD